MSRWRWAAVWSTLAIMVALGIATSKDSYAYRFLSGQCFAKPMPAGCMVRMGRFGGPRGLSTPGKW